MKSFANKDNCLRAFGKTDVPAKPKKPKTTFVSADPRWSRNDPSLDNMLPSSVKIRKVGGIVRQIECPEDLADDVENALRKNRLSYEGLED
jgi:hypothetical protein